MAPSAFAAVAFAVALAAAPAAAMYGARSNVVQLDESSFKDTVLKSDGVWMVEFYAPWCGHCKNLAPEWEQAATHLKGVVGVAAVDCDKHKGLAQKYQVQGFPTIKVFGADKRKPSDYQGERKAAAIVTDAMSQARILVKGRQSGKSKPSAGTGGGGGGAGGSKPKPKGGGRGGGGGGGRKDKAVVELTADNFEDLVLESEEQWMVEFFAPWCGHCKQLAPEWEAAAQELKGTVQLGAVDATVHDELAHRYGVKGYPTIVTFPPGPKTAPPRPYNGPRDASGIVGHAMQALQESGWEPGVPQLVGSKVFDKKCAGKKICVLIAVPHILDSGKAGRQDYLDKTLAAAKKTRISYFTFMWTEGGAQPALEEAMGLTFGYPALVAYSNEKKAYAVHVGSFSEQGIAGFLNGLMTGSTKTKPLPAVPKIQAVEEWDGEDAQAAEEEFSLEDLFGEEEL